MANNAGDSFGTGPNEIFWVNTSLSIDTEQKQKFVFFSILSQKRANRFKLIIAKSMPWYFMTETFVYYW